MDIRYEVSRDDDNAYIVATLANGMATPDDTSGAYDGLEVPGTVIDVIALEQVGDRDNEQIVYDYFFSPYGVA